MFVFSYVLLKNILIYFTTGLQWVLLRRYRCIDSLQHASQCKDANCKQSVCEKMKRVVSHTKMCKVMLSNISSPQFLSEPINLPAIYCWVISIGRVVFYGWNLLIFPSGISWKMFPNWGVDWVAVLLYYISALSHWCAYAWTHRNYIMFSLTTSCIFHYRERRQEVVPSASSS